MVLSTDMALHFDLMGLVKHCLAIPSADFSSDRHRSLLLQLVLHISDISNPARPFRIASRWAELVITEFLQQVSYGQVVLVVACVFLIRSIHNAVGDAPSEVYWVPSHQNCKGKACYPPSHHSFVTLRQQNNLFKWNADHWMEYTSVGCLSVSPCWALETYLQL